MKATPVKQPLECPCPCEGIIDIIGKKWTLCILASIKNEAPIRFHVLATRLPGVSPKTLSETLQKLEETGVVRRRAFAEVPPRVEYSLTKSGLRLAEAIVPLMTWAEEDSRV